jgi:hypothetical protein
MKASEPGRVLHRGLNPNAFKAARQLGMFNKPVLAENWLATPALVQACGQRTASMWSRASTSAASPTSTSSRRAIR